MAYLSVENYNTILLKYAKKMIHVEKALQLVDNHLTKTETYTTIPLAQALGCALAEDVISPIHMPPFRQSAMDGYALGSVAETNFTLIGEVKAGDNINPELHAGEAIRIFTGAPVPEGAKAVMMQEKTEKKENMLLLHEQAKPDANIRPMGEQIKKGEVALPKGTVITAAAVGYLATLGVIEVTVYQKPSIAIIATGNELIAPGQPLQHGQIYESNSIMLSTALAKTGFTHVDFFKIEDEYETTLSVLDQAITHYDVIVISGGISVGDYDFVGKALRNLEVEEVFYKVKQKPGKPLYFAKKQNTTIFALPGNPASSLSCFYVYVLPALHKISGYSQPQLQRSTVATNSAYTKKGERAEFLKALVTGDTVTLLDGQASSMLSSFALANALIYLPNDVKEIHIGDPVQVIYLP